MKFIKSQEFIRYILEYNTNNMFTIIGWHKTLQLLLSSFNHFVSLFLIRVHNKNDKNLT